FEWVKSRLERKAQPVPPIFQPEVAAEAIVWAAAHRRREVWVGWPTVKAILLGAKIFPRAGDWWLAKKAYGAQQTPEPRDPSAPNNLWRPVAGDYGAHGAFDARARSKSIELWATEHRVPLALAAAAVIGAGAIAAAAARA